MEEKRFQLWQLLFRNNALDDSRKTYRQFESHYFVNESTVETLWSWLTTNKEPGTSVFYYNNTFNAFFRKFACDLPWAKTSENCKVTSGTSGSSGTSGGGGSTSGGGGGTRGGGGGRRTSAPPSIPQELGNTDGVKKFQDWLDQNKSGWATGYTDGKLSQGGGYGRFGPRTSKAWAQYKTEYLGGTSGTSGTGGSGSNVIGVEDVDAGDF
jgi:hypothetical protein